MPGDAWQREVFAAYARERAEAPLPGLRCERLADITRYHPAGDDDEALLAFARFDDATVDARIEEELAALRQRNLAAEWKVHGLDRPPDLADRLRARGLANHHVEALMVLEMSAAPQAAARELGDVVVAEASEGQLDALAAFQEAIWNCRLPWLADALHAMVEANGGTARVYCATHGERIVGSGWIDFHGGSRFAQLCGGAVEASLRGRGVYGRLFDVRIEEARRRAVPFIAVDAAPMSRPILERRGFRYVCDTLPMRTRPFATGPVTRA